MSQYSTRQAAEKLGLSLITLQRYIVKKRIPVPRLTRVGAGKFRIWTERDIENLRRVLPSLKNGRKTRYTKQQPAVSPRQRVPARRGSTKSKRKPDSQGPKAKGSKP